jgi:hypothetical protein
MAYMASGRKTHPTKGILLLGVSSGAVSCLDRQWIHHQPASILPKHSVVAEQIIEADAFAFLEIRQPGQYTHR